MKMPRILQLFAHANCPNELSILPHLSSVPPGLNLRISKLLILLNHHNSVLITCNRSHADLVFKLFFYRPCFSLTTYEFLHSVQESQLVMATHTVLHFSPSKTRSGSAVNSPHRSKQPSPEQRCLPYTTVILPPKRAASATETGSPVKKLKGKDGEEPVPGKSFFPFFTLNVR